MSSAVGNIFVGLHYDGRGLGGFSSAANTVLRDSDRMRRSFGNTQRGMDSLRHSMSHGVRSRFFTDALRQATAVNNELARMRSMVMAIGAITGTSLGTAFAVTGLMQTADQAHLMRNQLRTVTESEQNLLAVRERLFQLSQETRSDLQSTIIVYARLSRATEHLGLSQERLVRATETIQKAFAIGGATQQEAWGAAIQLSQGIASDRFSGEEFRSVAENAPVLLRGMAASLGIGIGKLREMAHAGQLTASVVTQAILDASDAIDANFAKIGITVGQSLTRVQNAFLMYIGDADEAGGYTRALAHALTQLAENLDDVMVGVAGMAGLGLAWGGGRAISGVIGNQVRSTRELIKLRAEELSSAKNILSERQKELNAVRASIAAQQARLVGIIDARHAVGRTSADIQKSYQMERVANQAIMGLRRQQVGINKEIVAAMGDVERAQRRITAGAVAMQRIQRIGGGILNFMGGWTGVGFMAAIAGIGLMANEIQKARHRSEDLTRELYELGLISDRAAGAVDRTTQSLEDLAADELRTKLREINEEIENLTKHQNVFEKMFNYDGRALGNIRDELNQIIGDNTAITGGGRTYEFAPDSQQGQLAGHAAGILALLEQVDSGALSAEAAIEALTAAAADIPDLDIADAGKLDDIITRLRITVELLDAFGISAERVNAQLNAIADSEGINAALRTPEALRKVGDILAVTQDSLRSIEEMAAEQVRVAGLSDEQARLENIIAGLRKDAVDKKQEDNAAVEAAIVLAAREIMAAEDRAEAAKKAREAIQKYREELEEIDRALTRMPEIGDNEAAVSNIRQMVAEFVTGNLEAATLHRRLDAIGETNISAGMEALIKKIKEAIPQAAAILNIMRKFPGMGFLGSVDDSDATGDTLPKVDAAARAAADAAKRFREGMAELRREVELSRMDKFISDVVSTAEGLGIADDELQAFIETVQSDGLEAAPKKFRDIADALGEIKRNEILKDLAEDTHTMFMSSWDKNIFDTLKDSGIELDSVYGRLIANQIRFNDGLKMAGGWAREAFGGLVTDLMNGVSWTDALNNAVGRLRDRMMDMALDLIGNGLMGILQGMLPGMFGGSMSGIVNGGMATFNPGVGWMRTGFSSGTANTGGQRGEPRGIVHGQEAVIPLPNGGKVPVDLRLGDLLAQLASTFSSKVSGFGGAFSNSGGPYGSLKVEIVNESGQALETKNAGMRRENGVDIVTIVAGAMTQAAMGGKLTAFESIYGMGRKGA